MDSRKLLLNFSFYIRQAFLRRADEQDFLNRLYRQGWRPAFGIALSYLLK